jgi:hypothetical protein
MSRPTEYTNIDTIMERIQQIRDETRSRRFMAISNLYEINGWRDIRFEKNNEEIEEEEDLEYEDDTDDNDENEE